MNVPVFVIRSPVVPVTLMVPLVPSKTPREAMLIYAELNVLFALLFVLKEPVPGLDPLAVKDVVPLTVIVFVPDDAMSTKRSLEEFDADGFTVKLLAIVQLPVPRVYVRSPLTVGLKVRLYAERLPVMIGVVVHEAFALSTTVEALVVSIDPEAPYARVVCDVVVLVNVSVRELASGERVPLIVIKVIVGLAFIVTVSPAVIVTLSVVCGVVLLQLVHVPAVAQFPVPPLRFDAQAKSEAICH